MGSTKTDHAPDMEKFINLVVKAVGNERQNAFAKKSNLSPSHLNHLLRGTSFSSPSPDTIKKIAHASEGRVSLSDMLEAAGYDQDKYGDTPHIFTEPQMEAMYMSIITDALNATGIEHSLKKTAQNEPFDFIASLDGDSSDIKAWYFECVSGTGGNPLRHTVNEKLRHMFFSGNAVRDTKVSIIVDNETLHQAFLECDFGLLETHASIILVDINKMLLVEETPLHTALPLSGEIPKLIAQD